MNIKNLFGAFVALVLGALVFTSCKPGEPDVTYSMSETYLLGNCKKNAASENRLGMSSEHTYGVATLLKGVDVVAAGKKIVGMRMNIGGENVSGCEAFIGTDYKNPSFKQNFQYKEGGWNVVLFDEPIDVTNDDIYIGYNLTATGYALGIEETNKGYQGEMFAMDGEWGTLYNSETKIKALWSVQLIMVGGDYSDYVQNDILLEMADVIGASRVGDDLKMSCEVRNNGIKTAKNLKVKCSFAGTDLEVAVPDSLINGQSYFAEFSMKTPSAIGKQKVILSVEAPGFNETNLTNNKIQVNHTIYDASAPARNTIIVEQFTGQDCGYCPGGAAVLADAIAGLKNPEKVVWVANHYGYREDEFTINESVEIGTALGVQGAPNCAINRMPAEYAKGKSSLTWHPGYSTTELLSSLLVIPAEATLNLTRTFNEETRELSVTVSGNTKLSGLLATVIVNQSGIVARQASADANYKHNNAPRLFLTAAKGDALTIGADGNYTATYTATIPEKVGKFDCVLADMDVVAFVHGDIASSATRAVANADQLSLLDGSSAPARAQLLDFVTSIVSDETIKAYSEQFGICE